VIHPFINPLAMLLASVRTKSASSSYLPSYKGVVEPVHSVPGRLRLHIPLTARDVKAADRLKDMERIESVLSIQSNAVTGSVIIRYDPAAVEPMILLGAVIRILGLEKEIETRPQPLLWREFKLAGQAVNDSIYHTSAGILDLKTLVALGLMGTLANGLVTRSIRISTPGAFTLGWWIYQHLFLEKPS